MLNRRCPNCSCVKILVTNPHGARMNAGKALFKSNKWWIHESLISGSMLKRSKLFLRSRIPKKTHTLTMIKRLVIVPARNWYLSSSMKFLPCIYQKFDRSAFLQNKTIIAPTMAPPTCAKWAVLSFALF